MKVYSGGAVALGERVVVDGYLDGVPIRVQSHAHEDHLHSWNTSKQWQRIVCLDATRDLLIAKRNADLPYRNNLIGLCEGSDYEGISLFNSGHMLGSAQTLVETPDGVRVGYSGDFSWPLERVIHTDYLVLDATYSTWTTYREFHQGEAEDALVELVNRLLKRGKRVYIKCLPGTLERALECLSDRVPYPILLGTKGARECAVYAMHGFAFPEFLVSDGLSQDETVAGSSVYVRLMLSEGGRQSVPVDAAYIALSGFRVSGSSPVVSISGDSYFQVGLSDHADFSQVVEYVKASGAQHVLVDNTRGGRAVECARNLREALSVEVSYRVHDRE